VRPITVVTADEGVELRLLLQEVLCGGLGRLPLHGQMHALVAAILLGMPRLDALDLNAKPQPPDGWLGEAEELGRSRLS